MSCEPISRYPLGAWVMAAIFAPAALLAARGSWLGVLCAAVVCALLCCAVHVSAGDAPRIGRVFAAVQLLFLIAISSAFSDLAPLCWQDGVQSRAVPIILLLLAGTAVWFGAEKASRACAVTFWLVAILFAVVLAAGVKNIKVEHLTQISLRADPALIFVLLLPAAAAALPKRGIGMKKIVLLVCALFPAAVAALSAGMLSDGVAAALENPFYVYAKSVNLLGIAQRFEAVASVALTMSFFCAQCLLASLAGVYAEALHDGWGRWGVAAYVGCSACVYLLPVSLPSAVGGIGAVVFWVALPIVYWRVRKRRK